MLNLSRVSKDILITQFNEMDSKNAQGIYLAALISLLIPSDRGTGFMKLGNLMRSFSTIGYEVFYFLSLLFRIVLISLMGFQIMLLC
jgi:hypothetical protein